MSGARWIKRYGQWLLVVHGTSNKQRYIELVPGGKHALLWIGSDDESVVFLTVSGPATLRKLAQAILVEVGDE